MNTADDYPATMSVEQAGELLGLSLSSATRGATRSEIPVIRIEQRLLVPTAKLRDKLGSSSTGSASAVAGQPPTGAASHVTRIHRLRDHPCHTGTPISAFY